MEYYSNFIVAIELSICSGAQSTCHFVKQIINFFLSLLFLCLLSLYSFSFCKLFSFYLCFSLFLSVSISCPSLSFLFRKFWSNVCNVSCGVGLHLNEFHYKLESSWVAVDEVHAKQMASSGNDTDAGRRGTLQECGIFVSQTVMMGHASLCRERWRCSIWIPWY